MRSLHNAFGYALVQDRRAVLLLVAAPPLSGSGDRLDSRTAGPTEFPAENLRCRRVGGLTVG